MLRHVKPFAVLGFLLAAANQIVLDVPHNSILRGYLESMGDPRATSALRWMDRMRPFLPSGVGFAVGMYVAPRWTLPRVIGSVAEVLWARRSPDTHRQLMLVVASGLVLGEGTASIVTAVLRSAMRS